MRVEGEDDRRPADLPRSQDQLPHDRGMAPMDAVEIPDRHGPAAQVVGQSGQIAEQFHVVLSHAERAGGILCPTHYAASGRHDQRQRQNISVRDMRSSRSAFRLVGRTNLGHAFAKLGAECIVRLSGARCPVALDRRLARPRRRGTNRLVLGSQPCRPLCLKNPRRPAARAGRFSPANPSRQALRRAIRTAPSRLLDGSTRLR